MFKSFKEGLRIGWIKVDLEEAIKARGYHLVYYPSAEANRLAGIYPDVQETIDWIKEEKIFGMTIPNISLVIILKRSNPIEMVYQLHHEFAHVLTTSYHSKTSKSGHTTAFFEAEEKICQWLNIPVMERKEDYDENGKPIVKEGDI